MPIDDQFSFKTYDSSRLLPLTPSYTTDISYMENTSSIYSNDDYGPSKMRFVVITITAISFFLQV